MNSIKYEQLINALQDENTRLKQSLQSKEELEKDYDQQIQTLQSQIKELEDWNGDSQGFVSLLLSNHCQCHSISRQYIF